MAEEMLGLNDVATGQPFHLALLAEHLRLCDDSEWQVLVTGKWNYLDGVSVGADEKTNATNTRRVPPQGPLAKLPRGDKRRVEARGQLPIGAGIV